MPRRELQPPYVPMMFCLPRHHRVWTRGQSGELHAAKSPADPGRFVAPLYEWEALVTEDALRWMGGLDAFDAFVIGQMRAEP